MRIVKASVSVALLLLFVSCGSSKSVSKGKRIPLPKVVIEKPKDKKVKKEVDKLVKKKANLDVRTVAYISKYAEVAMEEMKKNKIPASITLAQGILESGSGVSQLALKSNNHFGVKCHVGWKGDYVKHDDDEKQECFRKYKEIETSYKDHSEFLKTRSRYDALFKLKKDDYKGWAKGLRKAGYATDKRYPEKLIRLIETYKLNNYDKIVLKKKIKDDPKERFKKHKIRKGDTLYSISRKHKLSVEELKALNNLDSNTISIGDELRVE
ncbi:glucosaminidase domain-containing protein [Flavicella sediminum]|uniref:glucosaminidase domain-containing protein n=1 Tax=Flavicella sediminum TaxID=2585141 RepID=UPI001124C615|nr:glucosaminidase domain-containing protein [Flavicella sediminum]